MPLTDQDRIALDVRSPRIVQLWLALQPLKSAVAFMQSGAHPDDEISAMLAALVYRDGFALSYACAVRGEGGQNDIGTEVTEDLGVLRTAEMERASDVLDMNLYWLSETPEDSIFDFGLSKDGKDTMARWGRDRVLKRFVEIVRTERPDILCPTFLDIPGQHGHHRAMTEAAHEVFEAAADPAFPVNLPVWKIGKLYLPGWSGAGGAYDDELPPPPATLTVDVSGEDPVTGWTWERIGQMSRAYHRTQGMGRWVPAGIEQNRPLHLAATRLSGPDDALADGLPDLDALGPGIASALADTIAAFPHGAEVLAAATEALCRVRTALDGSDEAMRHRLQRKAAQLARVIRLAAGVEVIGHTAADWLRPGEQTALTVEIRSGGADAIGVSAGLPDHWDDDGATIGPGADATLSDPYPPIHRPLAPAAPALSVRVTAHGETSETVVPLLTPPVVLPARSAKLSVDRAVLNIAADQRHIDLTVSGVAPSGASVAVKTPQGWAAEATGSAWRISAPDGVAEGLYRLPITIDGQPAQSVRRIVHPHTAPRARVTPAELSVRVLNADLPQARVGYIGGGSDRVGHWLAAMGCNVTDLTDTDLTDRSLLDRFDSLVIGIFALRFRDGLLAAMPAINRWVEGGGTLLTLYHRPWDNWNPDSVPPKRLEIGQPSLRWRVTDETAAVTHLAPQHPALNSPNEITQADWADWHKERGLYFAKSWDDAYQPLLEMADPDEAPHTGALLSADIGRGRHTHCALILHHQVERLVPGAFRLMANLIAPR